MPSLRRRNALLPTLVAGLLAGCAGGYDTQTAVRNAVDEFHEGFRWGALGSMLAHIAPDRQDRFLAAYEAAMTGLHVADYEVNRIQIADDGNSAAVWVAFSWYRDDEMVVHETVVRERWEDLDTGWTRMEMAVERGDAPPGLEEASAPPESPAP